MTKGNREIKIFFKLLKFIIVKFKLFIFREVKTVSIIGREKWHYYILKQSNDSTELYVDGEVKIQTNLPLINLMNMTVSLQGEYLTHSVVVSYMFCIFSNNIYYHKAKQNDAFFVF